MTHKQPAALGSPVFRICDAHSPACFLVLTVSPARSLGSTMPRQISGLYHAPPDLQPPRGLPARRVGSGL